MFLQLPLALLSGALIGSVSAETILGVTVYTRHGDRSSKHYKGYMLTNLGLQQNFQVGSDYRDLYISPNSAKQILGISPDKYVPAQIFASAPDEPVLLNTATAFLQGLYPPLEVLDEEIASQDLTNGSSYTNPLNGYQYVVLHGEEKASPDTIWIKGDDECPAISTLAETVTDSATYQEHIESTRPFYQQFWPILQDVYDYTSMQDNMSYSNAYDIFDLINSGTIHNASLADAVSPEDLFQLRTLADSHEFDLNFDPSRPELAIGARTLSQAILSHLNETVTSQGQKTKFSLLAGSYDTMMAFAGLLNLTTASEDFFGLPDYASTMAFEILTQDNVTEFPTEIDDLQVRFLFRNGSDGGAALEAFPLFAGEEVTVSWGEFVQRMQERAIGSVAEWCEVCGSEQGFCVAQLGGAEAEVEGGSGAGGGGGMSNAVAGVIGAFVTLGVVLVGGLGFALLRARKRRAAAPGQGNAALEKGTGSISS
ncbi:histidine phosphatase superfamily [Aspergillus karnatakaensis]|uniref:histidine phosphatase superfamily n=1 Tax=Aspergillus karnatakaensis TaxID=1810916 RepID=UPI003CCCFD20